MDGRRSRPSAASLLIVLAVGLGELSGPTSAAAQSAWVPLGGTGDVSFTFQTLDYQGHFDENGIKLDGAVPSRAFVGLVDFEYGLTDKLAFRARLPYISSRFTGDQDEPVTTFLRERYEEFRRTHDHAEVTNLDTGAFYSTFQDFGFSLRYNLVEHAIVVTPFLAATIPSHDYHTVGEASPGQNLNALHAGVNVGALLYPMLPRAYVHGRYTYSFVESLAGVPMDRSNLELEVGYTVLPRVSVRGLFDWLHTHGGVPFSEAYEDVELFLVHDRLLASRYWHIGAGATVALADRFELDGAFVGLVSGSDTHYGTGASIGLTWHFAAGGRGPASPSLRQRRP